MNLQQLELLLQQTRRAIAPGGELIEFTEADFSDEPSDSSSGLVRTYSSETNRRACVLKLRLTSAEMERLRHLSRASGRPLSSYVREKVFQGDRPHFASPSARTFPVLPRITRDTYVQLGRIATNINQQTRSINAAIGTDSALSKKDLFEYRHELEMLAIVLQQVRSELVASVTSGTTFAKS